MNLDEKMCKKHLTKLNNHEFILFCLVRNSQNDVFIYVEELKECKDIRTFSSGKFVSKPF